MRIVEFVDRKTGRFNTNAQRKRWKTTAATKKDTCKDIAKVKGKYNKKMNELPRKHKQQRRKRGR